MAKKRIIDFVMIMVTFLLCANIILFIAVPHHAVTRAEAIDLACDYFNYRMDNTLEIESAYATVKEKTFIEQIINYWNPKIKHYEVKLKTKSIDTAFVICIDAFTGYVYDGTEGIMWKR